MTGSLAGYLTTLLISTLMLVTNSAYSQPAYVDSDNLTEDERPWQEATPTLPPYPNLKQLQSFYVAPTARLEFSIDPASLQTGSDGVIRYTLVAQSRRGAVNVSFEGIRCSTFERKLYALGRPQDQTWVPIAQPLWQNIAAISSNHHLVALAREYFCPLGMPVSNDVKVLLDKLRNSRNAVISP